MLKKRVCFIINPISGIGLQKIVEPEIDKHLNKSLFDYEIKYTNAPKHATELAKNALTNGFDIICTVGGDGSINEVARALINSNATLAIIPAGSGNGLARHLKIPLSIKKSLLLINKGNTTKIDTVQLNNEYFINVAGVGFDAHIGWEFSKVSKRGFSSYIKLVLKEFPFYKNQEFYLTIEGNKVSKKAFLITFANGSQWGNNAYISPHSKNNDGILNIAILKDVTLFNFFYLAFLLLTKKLHTSNHLELLSCKEVIVEQKNNIAHIDGEPIEVGNKIEIKINPLSLNVIVP